MLEVQVGQLLGLDPRNVLRWLFSNPNGPDKEEQAESLRQAIEEAESPERASQLMMEELYSRLAANLPGLRKAASQPD
jgi:hypothetical protein